MTTLYRPVLIESAEQAEALPRGTVATYGEKSAKLTGHHVGHVGTRGDVWLCIGEFMPNADMVGWTALVPIEAEEEWKTLHEGSWHLKSDEDDARRDVTSLGARRRYTTDWEEA